MTTKLEGKTNTAILGTKVLREAMQRVNLVKPNKESPIYSYALVECTAGRTTITAINLERSIKVEIPTTNNDTFSMLLPRKTTEKFLIGGNGETTITQDNTPNISTLSRDGIGSLTLNTPKVEDFPIPKAIPKNLQWKELDGKWFCSMLPIVVTSCAKELSRPILTGVACKDGEMASADGFRLTYLKDERLSFGLGDKQGIIPSETINMIIKLFGKEKSLEVAFENSDNAPHFVYFKSDKTLLCAELIQGAYPQYELLIPNDFNCKASFSAPLLAQRLNLLDDYMLMSNVARFMFGTLKGEQLCSIRAGIEGEGQYSLSCPVTYTGDAAKIAFNYQYIIDAVKSFSMCHLEISSPSSPGKLTGDIEGLIIVIMPMFVEW